MDYILQFHSELAQWVNQELNDSPHSLSHNGIDISRAIFNFLWYQNLNLRDEYIAYTHCRHYIPFFKTKHIHVAANPAGFDKAIQSDLKSHKWRNALCQYRCCTLVFGDSERRLRYLAPIVNMIETPTIILTQGAPIPSEIKPRQTLFVLPISLLTTRVVPSSPLFTVSPVLSSYIHTIYCYINWLQPSKIICCDGCQTQYQLAAIFGKELGIESICYQFGWPGFIHAGFSNLPFSTFVTWGAIYSKIMKRYNRNMQFIENGRLGHINPCGTHDCITFFMQAPIFVSSTAYYAEFISAIKAVVRLHPNRKIIVRPHPEFGSDNHLVNLKHDCPTIELNGIENIEDTYRRTLIAISQYSSCLVESELFGCNAICFNQTHGFNYEALPPNQHVDNIDDLIALISKILS